MNGLARRMSDGRGRFQAGGRVPGRRRQRADPLRRHGPVLSDCYNGDRPPCRCACPADLDVISLVAKLQKGNFNGAYTMYRDKVLFPAIVCRLCEQPCLDACVRKDIDASITLRKLERAAVEHAESTAPARYRIPRKDERVAVVGAGLCGLSATFKLASHGYAVTLFERSDRVGGRLWGLLPPAEFVAETREPAAAPRLRAPARTEVADPRRVAPGVRRRARRDRRAR